MMNHQGLLIRASPTIWHIGLASFNFYKNDKNTSPTVRHTAWQILATRKKQPLDAHICALSPTWHRRFHGKKILAPTPARSALHLRNAARRTTTVLMGLHDDRPAPDRARRTCGGTGHRLYTTTAPRPRRAQLRR